MAGFFKCHRFLRLSPAHLPFRLYSVKAEKKGLVLGVYHEENKQGLELTSAAERYSRVTDGKLLESLKFVNNEVKPGKSYVFWGLDCQYQAIAVVGLGKKNQCPDDIELIDKNKEAIRIAAAAGCKALQAVGVKTICMDPLGDPEAAAEGSALGLWKFQECKTKQKCPPQVALYSSSDCANQDDVFQWNSGVIKANAQNQARRLADMPSNLMTPTIFAQNVEEMFAGLDVAIEIHDEAWAKKRNMNAFLAVAKGSQEPPKFVELTYTKGSQSDAPYILVGKGVTFDSGGISIKPAGQMDEMRADMGGAAACVAALQALARYNVQANIKVLVPLCENMPSGNALKPGDVIKAMNGKTVCVDNTDAEGRLILADALTYAATFCPKWILDIATLTGAMRIALGNSATGVFTNSNKLFEDLQNAGCKTGDRVWRFPLWKHYSKFITEYPAYDVNNIGKGKGGGACTAAAFLKEFVPEGIDWLHLDIAGVMGPNSDIPYIDKGMTGRPTRTLVEFIENQSKVFKC